LAAGSARIGGPLEDCRSDIVGRLVSGEKIADSDEIPVSASCKRVLQYSAEEADRLSHGHVGTEHLLLGLLREERSVAAEVLAARGLRIEAVREGIVKVLSSGERPELPGPPPTPARSM
jgi:ATP-dependent Clp protease ATP-binding subunit ClpC